MGKYAKYAKTIIEKTFHIKNIERRTIKDPPKSGGAMARNLINLHGCPYQWLKLRAESGWKLRSSVITNLTPASTHDYSINYP
ncbi:hypothetical protein R3I93_017874 [Phoxinus phoxinus]|uniref:Uncharacterized protein n=1 Tax=Phoxinus phoxinus TaxID=58324 RepID=A0AAN9CI65_9TELE